MKSLVSDIGEAGRRLLRAFTVFRAAKWLLPVILFGCASYGGSGLRPGLSSLEEVLAVMGPPARQWTGADSSAQLSYPRGPVGLHSYMVFIDARGRLDRIENVMTAESLAKVKAEMGKEEVLRLLGPPVAEWTVYFPARRELAWEWRYCNSWSMIARFHVRIDNDTGRVRSTMSFDETGPDGGYLCAR
jgi:hypothetical protein